MQDLTPMLRQLVALASCLTASRIEGRMCWSPIVVRPGTCEPGEWHQPHHRCLLQSASTRTCVVPWSHNSFGDRGFGGPACMEQSAILLASANQPRTV